MRHGEKKIEYSPEWKGPLKDRSCTDWPCLAIFVVFIACWVAIGSYALIHGDAEILLAPRDSEGRICGYDAEVANEPNLVFFDLTQCLNTERKCKTPQVCREECPSSNWYWEPRDYQSLDYIKKNIICETGIDVTNKTKPEFRDLLYANKCAKWFLNSTSIMGRCIPRQIPIELINVTMSESQLKDAQKFLKALVWVEEVLDAAIATRGTVLALIAGGAVVCLVYLFLLRWLAFPFVFLSAVVLASFFGYLSYIFSNVMNVNVHNETFITFWQKLIL